MGERDEMGEMRWEKYDEMRERQDVRGDELLMKDNRWMEGPTSVSTTFVVEVLDLCPQRIAGVISYKNDDDDDDNGDDYDDDDNDEMMMIIHTTDP